MIDVDASGEIDFEEYKGFFTKTDEQIDHDLNEATTAVLFEALDTDGNGHIDKVPTTYHIKLFSFYTSFIIKCLLYSRLK